MSSNQGTKSKHWIITINNYKNELITYYNPAQMKFLILGKEKGEDGTPHLQGYVCFINRKHLTGAKKLFPRAHLEIKYGTVSEAITYCKKDGNFLEFGTVPLTKEEGTKRKWEEVWDLAKKG